MKITDKRTVLLRMAAVREVVMAEITGNRGEGGLYERGLSAEGFAGGYLQALDDIDGALTHGYPSDHRGYWATADRKLRGKSNVKNSPPQNESLAKNRKSQHNAARGRAGLSRPGRRPPHG